MPNEVFNMVVAELEGQLGDILAKGITKKAVQKVGATDQTVSSGQMVRALELHIRPTLHSFMTPEKSRFVTGKLRKRLMEGGSNA